METVLVKGWAADSSHDGGVLINKSDFDPEVHELFHKPVIMAKVETDFLSRSVSKIVEDFPAVTDEELAAYLETEKADAKPRAGLIDSIEKELASRETARVEAEKAAADLLLAAGAAE